jgi:hypothetical protein
MAQYLFNIQRSFVVEADSLESATYKLELDEDSYRGAWREVTFIEEIGE